MSFVKELKDSLNLVLPTQRNKIGLFVHVRFDEMLVG
jgi:hypothetical protein